ncbi:hypothetical protein RFI_26643 [Reticulomyxa filosa]|uniref:Uncharacterized protein n=1 Tax=Reticulomyxa filosa TaxID=46433 RepID=X6M9P9_RETFI|nr:hypothetical protein RFI_26643 [Reticulomyxa filosa]|eukprot:ETO10733.1 hypothetical protein RFI_26643 [Reticulomyxa filosa]
MHQIAHKDSDNDVESSDTDFNFGDMNLSDNDDSSNHSNRLALRVKTNTNLQQTEPKWFLNGKNVENIGKVNKDKPKKPLNREDEELNTKRYQCEYMYTIENYEVALRIVRDIFDNYNVKVEEHILFFIFCHLNAKTNKKIKN